MNLFTYIRINLKGASENETTSLQVKQFDGFVFCQMANGFDEKLDQKVDSQRHWLPWQVMV